MKQWLIYQRFAKVVSEIKIGVFLFFIIIKYSFCIWSACILNKSKCIHLFGKICIEGLADSTSAMSTPPFLWPYIELTSGFNLLIFCRFHFIMDGSNNNKLFISGLFLVDAKPNHNLWGFLYHIKALVIFLFFSSLLFTAFISFVMPLRSWHMVPAMVTFSQSTRSSSYRCESALQSCITYLNATVLCEIVQ